MSRMGFEDLEAAREILRRRSRPVGQFQNLAHRTDHVVEEHTGEDAITRVTNVSLARRYVKRLFDNWKIGGRNVREQ